MAELEPIRAIVIHAALSSSITTAIPQSSPSVNKPKPDVKVSRSATGECHRRGTGDHSARWALCRMAAIGASLARNGKLSAAALPPWRAAERGDSFDICKDQALWTFAASSAGKSRTARRARLQHRKKGCMLRAVSQTLQQTAAKTGFGTLNSRRSMGHIGDGILKGVIESMRACVWQLAQTEGLELVTASRFGAMRNASAQHGPSLPSPADGPASRPFTAPHHGRQVPKKHQ
jgi:hypothetical protein